MSWALIGYIGTLYVVNTSLSVVFGKIWKNGRFFRAAMAGLGKYHTGGYGRIGVYRVLLKDVEREPLKPIFHWNLPLRRLIFA